MATIKLNGETFKPLLVNGAQFLLNDIDRINALNVFPVPDGDTGTNMCLTIEGGVKEITSFSEENIGKMFKRLARSMTMSARGNSGVILSQFFKGMSNYLVDKEEADVHDLIEALLSGVARSYKVVQTPTEGTMLTVMREAAEYVKEHENEYSSIDDVLVNYVKAAQISLDNTPNLLPVLKEAGVVDSGGAGFVLIFEGMLLALNGTILKHEEVSIEVEGIILCSLEIPAPCAKNNTLQKIPFGTSCGIRNGIQTDLRLVEIAACYEASDLTQTLIAALTAKSSGTGSFTCLAPLPDRFVSLIDLFHFLFREIRERRVHIIVGMIFSRQFTIGFFHFFVSCRAVNTEDLVRIALHLWIPFPTPRRVHSPYRRK